MIAPWILSLASGLFQEMPKYQKTYNSPKRKYYSMKTTTQHNFLKKEALDTVRNDKLSLKTKQS